jgi:hypothetical protein
LAAFLIAHLCLGLWYFPSCAESVAECCDKPESDNLIMDEAVANLSESSMINILTAKKIEGGESPLIYQAQIHLPIAKQLKFE